MPIELRRCPCGDRYQVLVEGALALSLTREDPTDLSCPACGGFEFDLELGEASGVDLGCAMGVGRVYPYFDRGLGAWVESASHRLHLLRYYPLVDADGSPHPYAGLPREVPLTIADGFDTEAELDARRAHREATARARAEEADRARHDPNREELARAQAIMQRMIDDHDLSLWGL